MRKIRLSVFQNIEYSWEEIVEIYEESTILQQYCILDVLEKCAQEDKELAKFLKSKGIEF